MDSEVVDKPTEEHQKVYSVYITDSSKFPKMTRLYTFKHREVQEDTTDLSAVALRENMAYNICPSETGRNPCCALKLLTVQQKIIRKCQSMKSSQRICPTYRIQVRCLLIGRA